MYQPDHYGIVGLFDSKTEETARGLSQSIYSECGGDYYLKENTPHMTFLHGPYQGLEQSKIQELFKETKQKLNSTEVIFEEVKAAYEKFLFWEIKETPKSLQRSHERIACFLSRYINERKVSAAESDEESLSLTRKEQARAEIFGHPGCLEGWNPHITLLFNENLSDFDIDSFCKTHVAQIKQIALVRIAEYGSIGEILLTQSL